MCKDKDRQPSRGIVDTTDTSLCINPISYPISKIENQSGIPRKLLQLTTCWIDKQLIWGEGLVIVIKYSMKAPWLQRISAGVSWFSEGQAGLVKHKIVRILRPGATINQHQLSRVHCRILEKHIKYTLSVLFPDCYRVKIQPAPPDTARCRGMFLVQTKCEKKSNNSSGAMCSGLSFYYWDAMAMAMMLPKLYWSNLAFLKHMFLFSIEEKLPKLMMIKIFAFFCVLRR